MQKKILDYKFHIRKNKNFKLSNVFLYLIAITYLYNGLSDDIMDTPEKVLYVKDLIFTADIAALKDYIEAQGFTFKRSRIDEFDYRSKLLTTISGLIKLFTTNKKIYNHAVNQLYNARNKRMYRIYKKYIDSLMITKFNTWFLY